MDSDAEFLTRIRGADGALDLARAALAIAGDAYPDLDEAHHLKRLDDLAAAVCAQVENTSDAEALLGALDHHLFEELGYAGNSEDYYDPRNSYLNDVLDRRSGIPITLSVVYIEVGRRAGLSLEPVGFPGHFLVAMRHEQTRHYIDAFNGGRRISAEALFEQLTGMMGPEQARAQFPRAVAAVPPEEVTARMLRNLKLIHARAGDWERALTVCGRLVAVQPDVALERRDRGQVLENLEAWRAAAEDYRAYLDAAPGATDAKEVAARLEMVQQRAARLN